MKKHFRFVLIIPVLLLMLCLSGCFSEKKSVFYDSEWIMKNYDAQGLLYYHHLILQPGHKVMLRASYADSSNIIVWTGKYKINSRKFDFDFTECVRYENGEIVGQYKAGQLVKYYNGDFYYSVAGFEVEGAEKGADASEVSETVESAEPAKIYHLELIRPKNYFYGDGIDIFGNQFEDFVKFE